MDSTDSSLLEAMLSDDNDTRNEAEEFRSIPLLPPDDQLQHYAQLLVSVYTTTTVVQHRLTAAILLRRLFIKMGESQCQCSHVVLESFKTYMLTALQQETSESMRKELCDDVAKLAQICHAGNIAWPEITDFLFSCCDVNLPHLYESALNIISKVPSIFGDQEERHLTKIIEVIVQALRSSTKEVWMAAGKAMISFVMYIGGDDIIRTHFHDTLPPLLDTVEQTIQLQEDDTMLKLLLELAETNIEYLLPQLKRVLDMMVKLAGDEATGDSWRQLGLEMVTWLAKNAPLMVRKQKKALSLVVTQALKFMMELEDDSDWSLSDEPEVVDRTSNAAVGEKTIRLLPVGLGSKSILPLVMENIPHMLQSDDWRQRHAALQALSVLGDGCAEQMIAMLEEFLNMILPFSQDKCPQVRYATCTAIGRLLGYLSPSIPTEFYDKIVPTLFAVMGDFPNPRVQARAGAAMENFIEKCPKNILTQYTDLLVSKLVEILSEKLTQLPVKGTKLILRQMIGVVTTVADELKERFVRYYDQTMSVMKHLMVDVLNEEDQVLIGKTVECVTAIGLAVGKDKFMQDTEEVMQFLLKVQAEQGELENYDPQIMHIIYAWGRMCQILGDQFVQYLPVVMKPLLRAASLDLCIIFINADDKSYSKENGWVIGMLAHQRVAISAKDLKLKTKACDMIRFFAEALKEKFVEYTEVVAKIMVSNLKFLFLESVTSITAKCLPLLLECVQSKGADDVHCLWDIICDPLLEAICTLQTNDEVLLVMMKLLCKCIDQLEVKSFSLEQFVVVANIIRNIVESSFKDEQRWQEFRGKNVNDYDEETEAAFQKLDSTNELLVNRVADVIHSLFYIHGTTLLPLFDQLLPTFSAMLADDQPPYCNQWALWIFNDLLEHASELAVNYQQHFLQPMMRCICDETPVVREAAVFGIGMMAKYCAKDFAQTCIDALPKLTLIISDSESRCDLDSTLATENAIAAVTRVCNYLEDQIPLESVLPMWLSWLPIYESKDQAPSVYSYLCKLIESKNPLILGENNCNFPRIVQIFTRVVEEDGLSECPETYARFLSICRHIQLSDQVWASCMELLTDEQQEILASAMD
ncbi:importin-5-like isoform X2 [Dysidea avara]|uniref:importin-5-like isoform X2 n=1 Tax=Dysidea avara TaxID=196820 RepID=UPI00331760D4